MKEAFLLASGILLLEFLFVSGCYITNCPPGGKRSGSGAGLVTRECQRCGPPEFNGLCYGPHICCSPEGCLLGTSATMACVQENLFHTTPCKNPGKSCSGSDDSNAINGQCAAPGICCSTETCTMNETCRNHGSLQDKDEKEEQKQLQVSTMFQNPLDQWIPRRLGLGGTVRQGLRKPVHLSSSRLYGNQEPGFIVRGENLISSVEDY